MTRRPNALRKLLLPKTIDSLFSNAQSSSSSSLPSFQIRSRDSVSQSELKQQINQNCVRNRQSPISLHSEIHLPLKTAAGGRQNTNNRSIEFERGKAGQHQGLNTSSPQALPSCLSRLEAPATALSTFAFLPPSRVALARYSNSACPRAGKFEWQGFCKATTCKSQEQNENGWLGGWTDGHDSYRESGVSSIKTRAAKGKGEEACMDSP